jgi:flavodoxin
MKILMLYSSLTGNTQKVAESMGTVLPEDSISLKTTEAPDPTDFEVIFIGFWVDKGQADAQTLAYLEKIKNKKVAFFYTLGAYPDSDHAQEVAKSTTNILKENGNQILGYFCCQGKVDPKLLEYMKKNLPPDDPHNQMNPERQNRIKEATKHPDNNDLSKAKVFAQNMLTKID